MPAKPAKKKKAKAPLASAPESASLAQLNATANRFVASLDRLMAQQDKRDAKLEAEQAKRDAKLEAEQAKRDAKLEAEQAKRDAKLKAERDKRDAEFRKEQAERDAKLKAERDKHDAKLKAERDKHDAKLEAEQAKRDAKLKAQQVKFRKEQAKRDAEFRKEQAERDAKQAAHVNAWMERLGESDEKTRKRVEDAEKARGRVAEALFRKALPGLLAKEGMPVDHVVPRALKVDDREYDFIARNGKMNFVGEIKVRFRVKDLLQLRGLLASFREDCPELAGDRPIYGVVCGMVVDEDAANIARRGGFLVVDGRTEAKLHMPPQIRNH